MNAPSAAKKFAAAKKMDPIRMLRRAKLRPTRQRLALLDLLFSKGDRHVSAESLYAESRASHSDLALATVYNCLHRFAAVGLLQALEIRPGKIWYDTNTEPHHHFIDMENDELIDIPAGQIKLNDLPTAPAGKRISRVDLVLRLEADPG